MAANSTVLLTGATGLVGRFLLAGLMRRRVPTIVLVRSQSLRPAMARIDEALSPFESVCQLPRPTVLEGDLAVPGLGLDAAAHELLRTVPLRILHSAASIRFVADGSDSEPYATNVNGTRELLSLAQGWNVEQFHHVSTAYVQCDRSSQTASERTAFEIPVNSLAKAGNDYERSKIQSEQMVLACNHVGTRTIYRPSIVVGDSQSGYTSTFHGFYAPLQIALGLIKTIGLNVADADHVRRHLGLHSHDSKNLVPVDWLAEAILHLMLTPQAVGGIYHLTHPQPASLSDMQLAIIDALAEIGVASAGARPASASIPPELFSQQMEVYESYFQDDPPFDRTHADKFLTALPCPVMDYARLKHLALAALKSNFGWPKPPPPEKHKWQLRLQSPINGAAGHANGAARDAELELQLLGPVKALDLPARRLHFCRRSCSWELNSVLSSSTNRCVWTLLVTEQSLMTALSERRSPEELLAEGRWCVNGVLPHDWLDIVRDCLKHLHLGDAQNAR